ncbi:MAG TPA: hypothetical protein VK524_12135 [Polyangiaceae bacterium]|nr:hypothetical protein [Polyangiaceae bacterium]
MSASRTAALLVLLACSSGCEQEAVDSEPARAVEELVLRMQRVHGDPQAARAAYDLLWAPARENLAHRAKRASAVSGRKVLPEEMLAPSRFFIRFQPKRYRAEVSGDWALVALSGEGADQNHTVKCVREQGRWRVVMDLPPPPAIQKRLEKTLERE